MRSRPATASLCASHASTHLRSPPTILLIPTPPRAPQFAMLGAALAAYDAKVERGEVAAPSQPAQQPPSLAGLQIGGPSEGKAMYSQSLPSRSGMPGLYPPKPRMRPVAEPMLEEMALLELPEPSPHSSSLLDEHMSSRSGASGPLEGVPEGDAEDGFVGGTCVPLTPRSPALSTPTATRHHGTHRAPTRPPAPASCAARCLIRPRGDKTTTSTARLRRPRCSLAGLRTSRRGAARWAGARRPRRYSTRCRRGGRRSRSREYESRVAPTARRAGGRGG